MKAQDLIERYLTLDHQYIKPMKSSLNLKTREDLMSLLQWWHKLSNSDAIGNLVEMNNNTALVILNQGSNTYYINADTKKDGVIEFLKNKENSWHIIINENGVKNKVTNRLDKEPIEGFYMYKRL
ncbi:MAG: hypothetical protein HWE24_20985 [Oceanospirillaceae bacterium]|nr:hypothetical protein [Oceanospirillaceae bacterium]